MSEKKHLVREATEGVIAGGIIVGGGIWLGKKICAFVRKQKIANKKNNIKLEKMD